MIPTGGAFLRLGLLVLFVVLVQISVVTQTSVFGAHADLVPLLVAAVGLYAGSQAGAGAGFATGLLLDLATGLNVGVSSLVLTTVGYGVGRYRESRDPANSLLPLPVAAAATAVHLLAYGAVNFMLDVGAQVSPLVLRDMLVTIVLNVLLALPVFFIVRRVLRPVLVADPLDRPRRARRREAGPIGLRGLEV